MKVVLCSGLFVLLVQASSLPSIDWSNLITGTGFVGLVWYFVVKHIPAIEDRHRTERTEWIDVVKDFRQTISDTNEQIAGMTRELDKLRDKVSEMSR